MQVVRKLAEERGWDSGTKPAGLLDSWSGLVAEAEQGYDWGWYEYSNDVSARDLLEAILADPRIAATDEAQELSAAVRVLDARLRALMREDVEIGAAGQPWWRRGVLRRAGDEYADDIQRSHGLTVRRSEHH